MNTKRLVVCLAIMALLAAIPAGVAFAKEMGMITISGGGLATPIEIKDSKLLSALGPERLEDVTRGSIKAPTVGKTYFEVARGFTDETGKVFAWERLNYYPDPAGGLGYVFYVGMDGESAIFGKSGKWFHARPDAETALQGILSQNGITFAAPVKVEAKAETAAGAAAPVKVGAEVETVPQASAVTLPAVETPDNSWVIPGAVAGIFAGLIAGWIALRGRGRKAVPQPVTER